MIHDDMVPTHTEQDAKNYDPPIQHANKRLCWYARDPEKHDLVVKVHQAIKSALESRKQKLEAGLSINHNKCQYVYDTNPALFEEFGIVDPKVIGARLRDLAYGRSTDRSGTLTQELTQDLYFYAGPASKRVAAAKQQQRLLEEQQKRNEAQQKSGSDSSEYECSDSPATVEDDE